MSITGMSSTPHEAHPHPIISPHNRVLIYHLGPKSGLFIGQFALVVLAPVLIAAAEYVLFGKLLESILPGGRRARALGVPARFVTYIFISGDILSFVLQGIGAGIMSGASDGMFTVTFTIVIASYLNQNPF